MSAPRQPSRNAVSRSNGLEKTKTKNPPRKPVAPVLPRKESFSAPGTEWTLNLPYTSNPIPSNGPHGHWAPKAAAVKHVRAHVAALARNAGIPGLERVEVHLTWVVGDKRRRDEDNLVPFLKAICDGLSAPHHPVHRIVEDDTPEFMVKHMPRIEYRPGANHYFFVRIVSCRGL